MLVKPSVTDLLTKVKSHSAVTLATNEVAEGKVVVC